MDSALSEPVIVNDAVLFKVTLKTCYINRKSIVNESLSALFTAEVFKLKRVVVVVIRGVFDDVSTEVNVFRNLEIFAFTAIGVYLSEELFGIFSVLAYDLLTII